MRSIVFRLKMMSQLANLTSVSRRKMLTYIAFSLQTIEILLLSVLI